MENTKSPKVTASTQNQYKIGDIILVPDPDPKYGDNWIFGNFPAEILDIIDEGEIMLIGEDCEGDCFAIEAHRNPDIM